MSRTIKYRVWDNENKSYNDPYSSAYYAMAQDGGLDFYCHGDHMRGADPDVYFIEQYTGLTDKNGKEIYEGDIVKVGDLKPTFKVEYNNPCTKFWMKCNGGLVEEFECWDEEKGIEVIGNIHENPELIGGEE